MSSVKENLDAARVKLLEISDAPQVDAERLMLHVLGKTETSWLHAHGEYELTQSEQARFEKLVGERASGKPLAYILGEWEFYGRTFYVNEHVLVPRPETEEIIDKAIEFLKDKPEQLKIVDLGTGSGCVAVTILCELIINDQLPISNLKFIATDVSEKALEVAQRNAKRHGVEEYIEFKQEDMRETLESIDVDLIVSNPPYVPSDEVRKSNLPDPKVALDGGEDGQEFVNKIKTTGVPYIVETTGGGVIWDLPRSASDDSWV